MNWRDRLAESEGKRREAKLERRLPPLAFSQGSPSIIRIDNHELIDFCSNDYLGYSRREEVVEAAKEAANLYGTGSRASRLIAGNYPLLERLEEEIARFKGFPSALVFPSGYQANIALLSLLLQSDDAVFVDRLAHACLVDGVRLSPARLRVFPHNDLYKLESLLKAAAGAPNRWIIVDGVYSMDGDLAPLPELLTLAERYDATLIVDDAHGTGTIGATGRGITEHFAIDVASTADRLILTATLSKALGAQGGVVLGSPLLRRALINGGRGFIYSTGLSPMAAGAALAAIRLLSGGDQAPTQLRQKAARFRTALRDVGIPVTADPTPIIPIITGSSAAALEMAQNIANAGFAALAIRPPTVPKDSSRVRLTLRSDHEDRWIDSCCTAIATNRNLIRI